MIIFFAANLAAAFAFNFLIISDNLGLAGTAAAATGAILTSAFGASTTSASAYFGASSVFFLSSVTVKSNADESISSFLDSFFSGAAAATSGFASSVGVSSAAFSSGDFSVA